MDGVTAVLASCFLISYHCILADEASSLKVKTQNGWVIGRKIADSMYGWNGIPYAKPPIGDLRFEPPQAPDNWTGIWNATYDRSQCVQSQVLNQPSSKLVGQEDCLYLNVYAPKPPQSSNPLLPVMVWIYGGGFLTGNSSYSQYGPNDLVREGVVVVSFNYRLGIFGFISTQDSVAPGNAGLKDQVFALHWVQRNIHAFGGNPKQVTIFGESAGGASVSYLVLSPLTKGLFQRAIMESGTALCPWSLSRTAVEAAYATGTNLLLPNTSSKALIDALKKVHVADLQRVSSLVMASILLRDPLNGLVYAPVIEPPSVNAVVTRSSFSKLLQGDFNQVPQIIGYNSAEAFGTQELPLLFALYFTSYDIIPARLVPLDMNANTSDSATIGREIKVFYAGQNGSLISPDTNIRNYLSDNEFVRSVQQTVNTTSRYAATYLYRFSYTNIPGARGAAHADELEYLFNSNFTSANDKVVRTCMVKLWTNFAKFSNPTPKNGQRICGGVTWNPLTPKNRKEFYYINIDRNVTVGENPNKANVTFWRDLYRKYGNPPYLTY